jgi:hypothetical protein
MMVLLDQISQIMRELRDITAEGVTGIKNVISEEIGAALVVKTAKNIADEQRQGHETHNQQGTTNLPSDHIRTMEDASMSKETKPTPPLPIISQPTFAKIRMQYLDVETLHYYGIPYEFDQDPGYLILLREMDQREINNLSNTHVACVPTGIHKPHSHQRTTNRMYMSQLNIIMR